MAIITTSGTLPLLLDALNLSEFIQGNRITASSTELTLSRSGGYRDVFTGTDVAYDSLGIPRSGVVTAYRELLNGATTYEITGLFYPVAVLASSIEAGRSSEVLSGLLSGDDVITGATFDDTLIGYGGHDNLFGGAGADFLSGGDGNDHLYGRAATGGSDGADTVFGNAGSDYLQGNAGNDSLDGGDGADRIQGGQGDDNIVGGPGNDTINGNLGTDTIDGGADNDSIRGGQGNDSISGGDGNDIVSGDLGQDILRGGAGTDSFQFSGLGSTSTAPDQITDFQDGADRISLGFTPLVILTSSAQSSLSAAGSAAQTLFDGHAGDKEVAAIAVGSDTYLFYASDGGATVNSAILATGLDARIFSVTDFV